MRSRSILGCNCCNIIDELQHMQRRDLLGYNWCNIFHELQLMRCRDLLGEFSQYLHDVRGGAVLDCGRSRDHGMFKMRQRSVRRYAGSR